MISPRCLASILPPAWSGNPKELKFSQNLAYFSANNMTNFIVVFAYNMKLNFTDDRSIYMTNFIVVLLIL
jgi:hypothetical protein